jgi:photosystem II stability/assembly factor-like uncharacterized protein
MPRSARITVLLSTVAILVIVAMTPGLAEPKHGEAGEESAEIEEALNTYFEQRAAPGLTVAPNAYLAAATYAAGVPATSSTAWNEIGPYRYNADDPNFPEQVGTGFGNVSGRITALGVVPGTTTVFAGGADGGVWKSTDSGQHWTPVFDDQATMSIGAIAIDPRPTTAGGYAVYVGTGEANTSSDAYAGVGVLRSTDGGATWTRIGGNTLNGALIWRVLVDPVDHRLYAATSHGLFRMLPGTNTWTRILGVDAGGNIVANMITDVTIRPGTGGARGDIVAVRGWREGAVSNGLYESTDGGDHFTGPLRPEGYVGGKAQGRVSLAWASNGTWLYAMVQDPKALLNGLGTLFEGLYLSKRGTAGPFNQIASPGKLAASGSAMKPGVIGKYQPGASAWYNQFLAVDPAAPAHVYMGLEEVYETTGAGTSWTADGPYWNYSFPCDYPPPGTCPPTTHPDQHAVQIVDGKVWVGNDGGVWSRPLGLQGAGHWTNRNDDLNTLQFYFADSAQANGRLTIYGGLQDNGTAKVVPGVLGSEAFGGDGGDVLVAPRDPNKVWSETPNLDMRTSLDGGISWTDIGPGDPLSRFISPFTADQTQPNTWVAGGTVVWVSTQGWRTRASDWTPAYAVGPGRSITAIDSVGGTMYAPWCGPCNPSMTTGTGFVSGIATNAGGTWHQLTPPLATRYPTAVTVDPADAMHAYVTYSGYSRRWIIGPDDPGVGHVFETRDGGAHWTDISGDLVDAPANDVVMVGGHLVVGTDVGVFVSGLHGGMWKALGAGLPTTVVNDLDVTPNGDLVIAATHGRGLWSIGTGALG